jgi:hypothetical protein
MLDAGPWILDERLNVWFYLSSIKHPASSPALAGFRFKSRHGGIGLRRSFASLYIFNGDNQKWKISN